MGKLYTSETGNKIETNPMGKPIRGRNADTTAPTVPIITGVSSVTTTSFVLSWTMSTDNNSITYLVYKNGILEKTTSSLSASITGLTAGASYTMTVAARDANGNTSNQSAPYVATTTAIVVPPPDTTAPTAPVLNTPSSVTGTSLNLSWSASTDNVAVTGYSVYKNGVALLSTTSTSTPVTGLSSATPYSFFVKAYDAAGNISAASNTVNATTLDTIAPSAPVLIVGAITETTVSLSWTTATDNVGVVGYKIYKDGALYATQSGTSIIVTPLVSGITYSFYVVAYDAANNLATSNTVSATTVAIVLEGDLKISFPFNLTEDSIVSAGLYNGDVLLRNMLVAEPMTAGNHTVRVDPVDDDLNIIPSVAGYNVKVLSNNVTHTWESTVGNTSGTEGPNDKHRGFSSFFAAVVTGGKVYYDTSYAEAWPAQCVFNLTSIQKRKYVNLKALPGTNQQSEFMCTDGTYVYHGGFDPYSIGRTPIVGRHFVTYVFANRVADDSLVTFPSGVSYKNNIGTTVSAIDLVDFDPTFGGTVAPNTTYLPKITSMAVQPSGIFLIVGYKDEIHILNKTSGALIRKVTVPTKALACDPSNNLWIGSGTSIKKYKINADGTITQLLAPATVFSQVLAMGASKDGSTIAVIDGGNSQQIKAFNNTTGASLWTLGQAGGQYTSPNISFDRFQFIDAYYGGGNPAISYDPYQGACSIDFDTDGSFWVVDGCNERLIHYSASRLYINHVQYLSHVYTTWVDPNNISRVFAGFYEFAVDYTKPLQNGNGSWTFVKNWGAAMDRNHRANFQTFKPVTFSNGRTYSFVFNISAKIWEIYELTPTGLRNTGKTYPVSTPSGEYHILGDDGSINRLPRRKAGSPITWGKYLLTGFDASNNPIWSTTLTTVASLPVGGALDPMWGGNGESAKPFPITSGGILALYDGGTANFQVNHVGGLSIANSRYNFITGRPTYTKYKGEYPSPLYHDIGNGVKAPGGSIAAMDNLIYQNYGGEFWKAGQTNMWAIRHENGLVVSKFGAVGSDNNEGYISIPEMAGNPYCTNVVKYGPDHYIYHGDEGHQSGIHRWKIGNLASIKVQTVTPSIVNVPKDPTEIGLMIDAPIGTSLVDGTNGWTRTPATDVIVSGNSQFTVTVGEASSDTFKLPDISIYFTNPGTSATVKRDLGTNNLSAWMLSGELIMPNGFPAGNSASFLVGGAISMLPDVGAGNFVLDIKDVNNKTIVRILPWNDVPPQNVQLIVNNNTVLFSEHSVNSNLSSTFNRFQDFSITGTSGGIIVNYKNNSVTVPLFDPTADYTKVKTMSLYFWNKGVYVFRKAIAFRDLKFNTNLGF